MDRFLRAQADLGVASGSPWATRIWHLDDVDAGDHFGDGVLDLDARIDLDEVELARVGIDQELDGAGVLVADALPICRAASQISSRSAGSRFNAGAISTTF